MKKADTDDYMFYDFAYTKHKKRKARTSLSSVVKNLPPNAGDTGSIPALERSPEGGHSNPLQYSCLKNSTYRGAWWAIVQRVAKRVRQDGSN